MRLPSSFKKDFLKKWVYGLQFYGSSSTNMSLIERKKAIKLSADVAMATSRNGKTSWSRALIANVAKQDENKGLVREILGSEFDERLSGATSTTTKASIVCNNRARSKKILRKSCSMRRISKHVPPPRHPLASSIAKRMVKRRTLVLKGLVPGGESIADDFSLIEETLDYMISLQAQVDIMRQIVNARKPPTPNVMMEKRSKYNSENVQSEQHISNLKGVYDHNQHHQQQQQFLQERR